MRDFRRPPGRLRIAVPGEHSSSVSGVQDRASSLSGPQGLSGPQLWEPPKLRPARMLALACAISGPPRIAPSGASDVSHAQPRGEHARGHRAVRTDGRAPVPASPAEAVRARFLPVRPAPERPDVIDANVADTQGQELPLGLLSGVGGIGDDRTFPPSGGHL